MRRPARRGFSLVELIVVVLVLAILATFAIPYIGSNVHERLESGTEILVSDLELVRSLAVSNSSNYRVTFDTTAHTYSIRHIGGNTALDVLPASPFHHASDSGKTLTAEFDDMPQLDGDVQLIAVQINRSPPVDVVDVEFNNLGSTTRTEETVLWLASGRNSDRRYLSVVINPTTGMAEPKPPAQKTKPTGVLDPLADVIQEVLP